MMSFKLAWTPISIDHLYIDFFHITYWNTKLTNFHYRSNVWNLNDCYLKIPYKYINEYSLFSLYLSPFPSPSFYHFISSILWIFTPLFPCQSGPCISGPHLLEVRGLNLWCPIWRVFAKRHCLIRARKIPRYLELWQKTVTYLLLISKNTEVSIS